MPTDPTPCGSLFGWSGRRRRSERMDASAISRAPSARTIARLMTIGRDQLSKAETVTVAAIESGVEPLVEAREVVANFQAIIRRKAPAELDPWIERAKTSLVAALANGVTKDKAAVTSALSSGWSNGQAEGQICKLQAGQAPDVWTRKTRSSPSARHRRGVIDRHQDCVRATFPRRNRRLIRAPPPSLVLGAPSERRPAASRLACGMPRGGGLHDGSRAFHKPPARGCCRRSS
jgi:hypothetical protein